MSLPIYIPVFCLANKSYLNVGVPKLTRAELETASEDFSNIIDTRDDFRVYKGTLSSGVEIAIVSTSIRSSKHWSKRAEAAFRTKVVKDNWEISLGNLSLESEGPMKKDCSFLF